MNLAIDVDAVINRYGGVSAMARHFTASGYPITKQGISRWKAVGIIPMNAWLSMRAIDKNLILERYLLTQQTHDSNR